MYHFICTGDQVLGAIIIRAVLEYENFVVPDAELVRKGPYRWMKHPNYAVVILEFIFLPLLYMLRSVLDLTVLSFRFSMPACFTGEDSRRRESARRKHRKIEIENHSHS